MPFSCMDIYILREGQETGPFSLETTHTLLRQGDVAAGDFAWRPGMEKWVALSELLEAPPAQSAAEKTEESPAECAEPATEKQKALLGYLGIHLPASLSKDQAARLVNNAMEDAQHTQRLALWNDDRLRLHPALFAAEIQTKKENRAGHFFELCQTTGAAYFSGITKAHCQVLVGFLDVKFPNWDASEAEAADHFFFPAVAEKFPQLVQKPWRGRLQYADGPKIAAEIARKSPTSKLGKPTASPLAAIARGIVLGVLLLGVLYLVQDSLRGNAQSAIVAEPSPESTIAVVARTTESSPPGSPQPPPEAPAQHPGTTPAPAPAEHPAAQIELAAAAPLATPPTVPPDPALNPPTPAAPTPAEPAMSSLAMAPSPLHTAPMATLPGAEPPVPLPPPPATLPTASTLPAGHPSEPIPAPTSMAPTAPVEPAPTAPRTSLLLTKPLEIQLAYGKMKLPAGTPVKLVARQGNQLKVNYQNSVITIPATSTDLE